MYLKEFKKGLDLVGASYELFESRVDKCIIDSCKGVRNFLKGYDKSNEALCAAFAWRDSPEGHIYWQDICLKLEAHDIIINMPEKSRKLLFEVLAKTLGYEIEE